MATDQFIAIVKFLNHRGATVWKAEMVGNGKRMPCVIRENHNPTGYVSESDARHEAKPFVEITGWPVLTEDQTIAAPLSVAAIEHVVQP